MTTSPNRGAYELLILRVAEYISAHLDEELTVDRLAEVAGFSKYHFHRQFAACTGSPVAQYVRLLRLKRAAYQLAFAPDIAIISVALAAGFRSPEAFSRAFKEVQGQTPSEFRRAPLWDVWAKARSFAVHERYPSMNPTIVQFERVRVAVLEHRGPPASLMTSVTRFVQWRKGCSDSPEATTRTFGVAYDDPEAVPANEFTFDICGELKGTLSANGHGVLEKEIPAGRCAVVRHIGSTDAVGQTTRAIYEKWLPESGEQLRDFPCFFHYVERMPAVAEHEQVTDIYVPLR